ncbi:hypothetical protein F5B19DRAFT_491602 [Rostrohypoxylon terebratum]|nr:hypothetical protein F5B19DRAFT_491602 [Rostrohypoxylon terebratum]
MATRNSMGAEKGVATLSVPASRVSSSQLKTYLDQNYPGRHSVQEVITMEKLKRDEFTVTVTGQASGSNDSDRHTDLEPLFRPSK